MKTLQQKGKDLAKKKIRKLEKTCPDKVRTHVAVMLQRASDNSLWHPLSASREIFRGMTDVYRDYLLKTE